ncbi:MAG: hypothetical protein WCS65_15695 [Verrucomicrobiae bacterium]
MRAVTARSVLNGVCARMGMDITQVIPPHTVATFLEYINSALRGVWERYPFPEWTRIEQRTYRADYAAGTAYDAGDEVFYAGAYYRALSATIGNVPTDAVHWEVADDLVKVISLDQAGETPIGEVIEVYGADPRLFPGTSRYGFSLVEGGLLVTGWPAEPWIEFTLRPPVFTSAVLDSSTFPYVLAECVKLLASADAQREDGQFEKGSVLESAGLAKLDEELDKIELKQGQQRRWSA